MYLSRIHVSKLYYSFIVLARSSTTETVLDEELDSLQFELESMLSSLAYKMNLMHIEIDVEDYIQKDHNKRLKLNVKQVNILIEFYFQIF